MIDSPAHNLFSGDLLADLRAAVNEAADSDIRALLLRAEGDEFLPRGRRSRVFIGLDEPRAVELETTVLSLIGAIEDRPVPTLALIHGQCFAGALEVCVACDLIWAIVDLGPNGRRAGSGRRSTSPSLSPSYL